MLHARHAVASLTKWRQSETPTYSSSESTNKGNSGGPSHRLQLKQKRRAEKENEVKGRNKQGEEKKSDSRHYKSRLFRERWPPLLAPSAPCFSRRKLCVRHFESVGKGTWQPSVWQYPAEYKPPPAIPTSDPQLLDLTENPKQLWQVWQVPVHYHDATVSQKWTTLGNEPGTLYFLKTFPSSIFISLVESWLQSHFLTIFHSSVFSFLKQRHIIRLTCNKGMATLPRKSALLSRSSS